MADLLIEFFCEEIPARMQARAEADLARLLGDALKGAGLTWGNLEAFSGPRRLGLAMSGLPLKTEAVREELKGPRHNAPEQAIQGFLNKVTGNASPIELAAVAGLEVGQSLELNGFSYRVEDTGKGAVIFATRETPGRDTAELLKTALPEITRNFPWPKSMKFGEGAKAQRWVRPLHSLICLLGGEVVPVEVFGLTASNITQGHRIHGSGPFAVTGYADYAQKLKANGVILTRAERRQTILDGARAVCAKAGLELIEDEGLLDEVTGLAEQPVAVMGDMDTGFLDLPPEVITLTMRTHQKYFAVRDPKTGALAPKFVTIANQSAPDGGAAIAAGNARVLSARLSDARHFWDLDRAKGLDAMAGELSKVTFHDKLGTVADKTARVAALARELAPAVGADPDLAELAARLAKADLVSQMVYEFPELQGVMGRYLALDAGMDPQVADAIRDHYKPQGPSDAVPTAPVSAAVALADKLDTLVGFWAIDEKPTGSKDPFALRRAALGVIRIVLERRAHQGLASNLPNVPVSPIVFALVQRAYQIFRTGTLVIFKRGDNEFIGTTVPYESLERIRDLLVHDGDTIFQVYEITGRDITMSDGLKPSRLDIRTPLPMNSVAEVTTNLLAFFADRLKVHLKDEGIRHDVIDAVFALGDDDLVRVTNKSRALQAFLDAPDGAALLAGYRRAANILSAEEKKGFDLGGAVSEMLGDHPTPTLPSRGGRDAGPGSGRSETAGSTGGSQDNTAGQNSPPSPSGEGRGGGLWQDGRAALLIAIAKTASTPQERALIAEIQAAEAVAGKALADEDFESAMSALAQLRGPVDAFFEAVVVNDKDPIVRRNRLVLLSRIRAAADAVADFSRLEG